MYSVMALVAVLSLTSARPPIPYSAHVANGGRPVPQHILDRHPDWWVRHQLADRNDSRIVGGVDAALGEIPYIYSLRRTSHSCGGSILSSTKFITAAHCVSGAQPSAITIRYNSLTHASGGTIVSIARIVVHPNYMSSTMNYDVALVYPSEPLTLGQPQADSIPLVPAGYDPPAGAAVLVSGWGSGSSTGTLKKVELVVVSRADCDAQYGAGTITPNMFCAWVAGSDKSACLGDNGGPYVINGLLAGETSWSVSCDRPEHAGVATNNGPLVNWINAN